ncbi:DinB/UmuC family translesion DNA polymerase, partial [Escherichia coli]|uniref:DinB/UmuC family translesion DNA polymerase n=1 Tax=Escherichia coli TaxID=562 RepID=UPI003F4EB88A
MARLPDGIQRSRSGVNDIPAVLSGRQYCRFISTFIKTSPFALNEPYYGNSASVKLLTPTQDSRDIINAATRSLDAIWQ